MSSLKPKLYKTKNVTLIICHVRHKSEFFTWPLPSYYGIGLSIGRLLQALVVIEFFFLLKLSSDHQYEIPVK